MMSQGDEKQWPVDSSEPVVVNGYVGSTSLWSRVKGIAALEVSESRMGGGKWSNADLDPIEPELRTWRTYNCTSASLPGNSEY